MNDRKVAIIGCGISGLKSAKEVLGVGYEAVIFESSQHVGGLWRQCTGASTSTSHNDTLHSTTHWQSLKTNISKYSCHFSDLPWPESTEIFPTRLQMSQYLHLYAEVFGLFPHVRFSCNVQHIKRTDYGYIVEWLDQEQQQKSESFRYVIIATGFFTAINQTSIPGIPYFKGTISHSSQFTTAEQYKERNVVVVGASHSAAEIAAEIAMTAKTTINIAPRRFYTIPRYIPIDSSAAASPMIPLDLLFYQIAEDRLKSITSTMPSNDDTSAEADKSIEILFKNSSAYAASNQYMQALVGMKTHQPNELPSFVAVSDDFDSMVKSKCIGIVYCRLTAIDTDGQLLVSTPDDQISKLSEIDDIILCTGYRPNLSMLDEESLRLIEYDADDCFMPFIMYRDLYHPKLPNLYMVGMYRGPYMAIIEQQAALVAGYISQRIALPSDTDLALGLDLSRRTRLQNPRPQFPHADYIGHAIDIARLSNRCPSADHLLNHRHILPCQFIGTAENSSLIEYRDQMLASVSRLIGRLMSGYMIDAIILSRLSGRWIIQPSSDQTDPAPRSEVTLMRVSELKYHCMSNVSDHPLNDVQLQYNSKDDRIECYRSNDEIPDYYLHFTATSEGWQASATSTNDAHSKRNTALFKIRFQGAYIDSWSITSYGTRSISYSHSRP
jgi:cation diffusion facilitator CzcD-associated flavoprotein CzcO